MDCVGVERYVARNTYEARKFEALRAQSEGESIMSMG
jgi:hypothetical protein